MLDVDVATPTNAEAVSDTALQTITGPTLPESSAEDFTAPQLLRAENRRLWGTPELLTRENSNHTPTLTDKINRAIVDAWNQGDPSAWIVARVVFQELKLTLPEYMKLSALDKATSLYHVLKPLTERARQGGLRDETYATLLRDWETLPTIVGEEHRPVLEEAGQRLKKYLLGKDLGTPFGLLRSWALAVGPAELEKRTDIDLSVLRKGRNNRSRFLGYSEFVSIGQKAGILPEGKSSLELWDDPAVKPIKQALWNEAGKFYRSKSAATALMIFEAAGARTVEELHQNEKFTLPWQIARSLHQYDLVPWKKVAPVFSALVKSGDLSSNARSNLQSMWRKEITEAEQQITFAGSFRSAISERSISLQSILSAMLVKEQSEIGDPKELVRFALEHELRYAALPIGVLAFFAGRSSEDATTLLELKRTEIRQTLLRRDRASTDPHPIRIERELWSVSLDELGDTAFKERVQATEWRRRSPSVLTDEESQSTIAQIYAAGLEKAEAALSNWLEENRKHPAKEEINNLLREYPGFSIAEFREQMMEELDSRAEGKTDHSVLESMTALRLQALFYGDTQTRAGTEARLDLYRDRATIGLPIFNEQDSKKTPYE